MIQQKNKEVDVLNQLVKEYFKKCRSNRRFGNKIADKISSLGKSKRKEKETSEEEEIIIPPEKRQQTINDLRLF